MSKKYLLAIVFAVAMFGGESAFAGSPLRLVLACDMPAWQLVYDYDSRTSNVMYIIHDGWGGDIFEIHICEDLEVPSTTWPAQHYFNNRKINADLIQWTAKGSEYDYHLRQTEVVNFEMGGRVYPRDNQVIIEGWFKNLDTLNWTGSLALMCLRSRLNPDFHDNTGERIYLFDKVSGRRSSVYSVVGYTSSYFNFWMPDPVFGPRLQKANQSLQRYVTIETDPCRTLLGNRIDMICCIHGNVALDVAPGETANYRTIITFEELIPSRAKKWTLYQ